MHIPDNYLSPSTCVVIGAAMVPVWSMAVKRVKTEITSEKMPILGVGAAYSFLIMMFNIPIPGGTTVHAVGGTLLAILNGPWAACISLTVTLLIQALLFGDGGILAFCANCFNLAFILPFTGYYSYQLVRKVFSSEKGTYLAVAAGAHIGLNMAALCAAIELGIQPILFQNAVGMPLYCPYPLSVSIPAMIVPHLLVAGVAEAAFTVAIFTFLKNTSPGTIYENEKAPAGPLFWLLAVLILLTPAGLLAAGTAWGEWELNGAQNGFQLEFLLPDYSIQGLPGDMGYIVSAAFGVAVLVIVFKIIGSFRNEKLG